MPQFAMFIPMIASAAGSMMSQGAQGAQGAAQSAAQRDLILKQYKIEERRQIMKDTELEAKAHAVGAGSGLADTSGSALEVALDNMRAAEMNASTINYQGKIAAGPKPKKPSTFDIIDTVTNLTGRHPLGPYELLNNYLGKKGIDLGPLTKIGGSLIGSRMSQSAPSGGYQLPAGGSISGSNAGGM